MFVKFRPQRSTFKTSASIDGNVLTYNGEDIDLSFLSNGDTATNEFLTIDKDADGNINISMLWNYEVETLIDAFPKDKDVTDGVIEPTEHIEVSEEIASLFDIKEEVTDGI